ncbi:MAG: hypothetical protein AB1638_02020 [Nitrospirota bacterium]
MKSFTLITLLILLVSACASKDITAQFHRKEMKTEGFTKHFEESLFKITGKGLFSVELLIKDHLEIGRNDFALIIHDNRDRDVEGARLKIVSRMPGSNITIEPIVKEKGYGLYNVENLLVGEPGQWEFTLNIEKDGIEDSLVFNLQALK